jgi:hypothetical protein
MRTFLSGACSLALALGLALPGFAQEEFEAEVVPMDEYSEDAAPAEETFAPAEEVAAEDGYAGEPEEPAEPLMLYVGVDYVVSTLSLSNGGAGDLDSGMYRARLGWRALEAVGLEAHVGVDNSDGEPGSVETKRYYGVFVVPTATVFEVVELAFPVGYAQSSFEQGSFSEDYASIAYGLDLELPVRTFAESLPDLRLTAGWMVYYQKSDARSYGANVGLRYDFQTSGFRLGNPLAGLWPFGDDDPATETAAAE